MSDPRDPAPAAPGYVRRTVRRKPNPVAALLSRRWGTLVPIQCPHCHRRVTAIAAHGGPVIVRHSVRARDGGSGPWTRCNRHWVAVPYWAGSEWKVRLVEVNGRQEEDAELQREAESWGMAMVREILRATGNHLMTLAAEGGHGGGSG